MSQKRPTTLRAWKEARGLSNKQFAQDLGYNDYYISHVLTGVYPLSHRFISRFIYVYGRTAAQAAGLLGK